jgi:Protein of unknown function (DUF2283)
MKIKYDKETDVLYIKFLDAIISESEDMNGIIFDYDDLYRLYISNSPILLRSDWTKLMLYPRMYCCSFRISNTSISAGLAGINHSKN